jgi:hypothetical protein
VHERRESEARGPRRVLRPQQVQVGQRNRVCARIAGRAEEVPYARLDDTLPRLQGLRQWLKCRLLTSSLRRECAVLNISAAEACWAWSCQESALSRSWAEPSLVRVNASLPPAALAIQQHGSPSEV